MIRLLAGIGTISLLVLSAAQAADATTVASLLKDGYEIKGVFPSNAGPGIVLEKGDQAVMCFVAETPNSTDVATRYCKPVN